jgi:hypothetical protein
MGEEDRPQFHLDTHLQLLTGILSEHDQLLFLEIQYKYRYSYTHTGIYPYEYMHVHSIPMSTFKRLNRLDLEIHEVGHQEHIVVDENVVFH